MNTPIPRSCLAAVILQVGRRVLVFALAALAPVVAVAQTSVTFTVSQNSDDADQSPSTGEMWVGDGYSWLDNYCGARFQNVTIPAGATITSATLQLYSYGSGTASFSVNMYAQDADTTSTFTTTTYELSNRPRTTATTAWTTGSTSYTDGQSFTSPNFASSIQEVVDRAGWTSGNALTVILTPVANGRGFWKRSGNASYAPRLHVTYSTSGGKNLLMVISGSTPNSMESGRQSQVESWGYTVTTIQDSSSQAAFDSAVASADVVYVPGTIQDWDLLYKLRTASCGVVTETPGLDTEFGFATSDGYTISETQIYITDASHDVTTGLSTGTETILTSGQPLALNGNTVAAGMTVLAKNTAQNQLTLGAVETGGTLANTYNGNSTASGRRVRLPWGNITAWPNSNGILIFQQALAWAAGAETPAGLHWKLDESSGTTATDSSGNNYDGTITGTTSWIDARRNGGLELDGASKVEVASLLGQPTSFTVAGWVRLDAADSGGAELISIGDYIGVRLDPGGGIAANVFFHRGSSSWEFLSGGEELAGTGWRHVAAVFDDSADSLKLYIDGSLVASKTTTDTLNWTGQGTSTVVGAHGNGQTTFDLDGGVDDIRVYGKALSEAEIAEVYGLIAHWKLDETAGTTAYDSSLASHDATRTGTEDWAGGVEDNGHAFDYTDGEEYFVAPTTDALNDVQADDYTVMAYFKPLSVPPGTGSANDSAYGVIRKNGWHIGLAYGNGGNFYMEHWQDSGPTWTGAGAWEYYPPGRFYHVAGVVSRTNGTVKIYVDGQLKQTTTFTPGSDALDYGSNPWRIGISYPSATEYGHACHGVVDDVRIYNRALSDEEIAGFDGTKLIAHWKLDEATGTTAADSSGQGHDAVFTNGTPAWTTGVRDAALDFNGASNVATSAPLNPPPAGTVAFWVQSDGAPAARQRLMGSGNTFEIWQDPDGPIHFDLNVSGGVETFATTESMTEAGQWRHIAVSFNSDTDAYAIYVDGELDHAVTYAEDLVDAAAASFSIGTSGSSTQYFSGGLDDVRIYNYELSESEIADVYGLIGHWKFDDGSGSTIVDSSLKGNDAAFLTGTPAWVDGARGGALEFDGTNDAATGASFQPPSEGTVCLWLKSAGPPAARQRPWGVGGNFEMWQDVDGLISCDVSTDGYQGGFITTEALDDDGRWRHLVAVFDSDDDSYAIYLDGQLHKSGVSTWAVEQEAAALLTFGTRTGSTQRFAGAIDDFRVYNRKLSAAEIADIYGLVGWWRFEEGSGSVAADSSGAGNDGAAVGSLGWSSDAREGTGSLQLNGANHVQVPGMLIEAGDATISGWAKLTSPDSGGSELISVGDALAIRLDESSPANGATVLAYNGSSWQHAETGSFVEGAGWVHFAAVYDHDTYELRFYVDGVLQATETLSGPLTLSGVGSHTQLGAHGNGQTNHDFSGLLDDLRVYNRALSKDEIRTQFYGGWAPGPRIIQWVETR
ncbi:MAG: hypothetical protein CMJ58_09535 [Planctomycetaceae bacterium]|nr:hypothetical protein [Planctomycetaceae bacterium]